MSNLKYKSLSKHPLNFIKNRIKTWIHGFHMRKAVKNAEAGLKDMRINSPALWKSLLDFQHMMEQERARRQGIFVPGHLSPYQNWKEKKERTEMIGKARLENIVKDTINLRAAQVSIKPILASTCLTADEIAHICTLRPKDTHGYTLAYILNLAPQIQKDKDLSNGKN